MYSAHNNNSAVASNVFPKVIAEATPCDTRSLITLECRKQDDCMSTQEYIHNKIPKIISKSIS